MSKSYKNLEKENLTETKRQIKNRKQRLKRIFLKEAMESLGLKRVRVNGKVFWE